MCLNRKKRLSDLLRMFLLGKCHLSDLLRMTLCKVTPRYVNVLGLVLVGYSRRSQMLALAGNRRRLFSWGVSLVPVVAVTRIIHILGCSCWLLVLGCDKWFFRCVCGAGSGGTLSAHNSYYGYVGVCDCVIFCCTFASPWSFHFRWLGGPDSWRS